MQAVQAPAHPVKQGLLEPPSLRSASEYCRSKTQNAGDAKRKRKTRGTLLAF